MKAGLVSSIDPHTLEIIEFPPLHDHHVTSKRYSDLPRTLSTRNDIPFLPDLLALSSSFYFPSGGADQQCLPEYGGTACQWSSLDSGYGRRVYSTEGPLQHLIHVQDIRQAGSLPISQFVEIATLYITEPHSSAKTSSSGGAVGGAEKGGEAARSSQRLNNNTGTGTLKPVFMGAMESTCLSDALTCSLPLRKAGIQFVTYYFPVNAEILLDRAHMHWHAWEGDEAWLVRGTQSDLGEWGGTLCCAVLAVLEELQYYSYSHSSNLLWSLHHLCTGPIICLTIHNFITYLPYCRNSL